MAGRNIVVDGRSLKWLRQPYQSTVRAWAPGNKRAPLRVDFLSPPAFSPADADSEDDWQQRRFGGVDGWLSSGVRHYDLNRPAVAAALIRAALRRGWEPDGREAFVLDGFALLREANHGVPHEAWADPIELATQLIEAAAAREGAPPLAWFRRRSGLSSWPQLRAPEASSPRGSPDPLLAIAGLIDLGFAVHDPAALTPAQRSEAAVWADARMQAGRAGGLAVVASLTQQAVDLADAVRWAEALLTALGRGGS